MGAKHTPGPWTIDRTSERHGQRPYGISAGKRGPTPKKIVNWGGMSAPASQESEANARLIASAPDLLEAAKSGFLAVVGLKMAMAVESNGWQWPDDAPDTVPIPAENLRAAIAKATGEAS